MGTAGRQREGHYSAPETHVCVSSELGVQVQATWDAQPAVCADLGICSNH